jgi:hypothetical protein
MSLPLFVEYFRAQSLNSFKKVGVRVTSHSYWEHGGWVQLAWGRVQVKKARERNKICMGRRKKLHIQILDFSGQQRTYECWILKTIIVAMFGSCLDLKYHRERGCVPRSDVLFKIRQGKHTFSCWMNLCCSCRIIDNPTKRFLV